MDILSTLNLFYEKNKDLILEIYNMNKCENCGGNFEIATCRYCGTTNKKLEETLLKFEKEIFALSSLLDEKKINELPSNNFFNLIHLLKIRK